MLLAKDRQATKVGSTSMNNQHVCPCASSLFFFLILLSQLCIPFLVGIFLINFTFFSIVMLYGVIFSQQIYGDL